MKFKTEKKLKLMKFIPILSKFSVYITSAIQEMVVCLL